MKRLLFIPFLLWASWAWAYHPGLVGVIGRQGGAIVIPCTGSNLLSLGDVEDFEYGTGDFCNSDWIITGLTNSDSYSTSYQKCGTHSLKLSDNGASVEPEIKMSVEITGAPGVWFRMYFTPNLTDGNSLKFLKIGSNEAHVIRLLDTGGVVSVSGDYYQYSISGLSNLNTYRLEMNVVDDGSTISATIRVFDSANNPMPTTQGSGYYDLIHTESVSSASGLYLYGLSYSSLLQSVYIDDFKYSTSGWIGAQVCN